MLQGINKGKTEVVVNLLATLSVVSSELLTTEEVKGLINVIAKSCMHEDVEVNAEALNVFFDVFCDEKYDEVLREAGIIQMMREGADVFRGKVVACLDTEIKEHAQEAYENLIEFIKYKAQHIPL
jgi:hypothetical protein